MRKEYFLNRYTSSYIKAYNYFADDINDMELADLLALMIGKGTADESGRDIADRIIKEYGSVFLKSVNDPRMIATTFNVSPRIAVVITASMELYRRFMTGAYGKILIRGPEDIYKYSKHMESLSKEHFQVVLLNTRNVIIHDEIVSVGTLSGCLVHPREVMTVAVRHGAGSFIVVHNHPSGDSEPSKADDEITKILKEAGEIMQIPLVDHVVVSYGGFYSYNKEGRL